MNILETQSNVTTLLHLWGFSNQLKKEVISEFSINNSELHHIRMGFGHNSVDGWDFTPGSIIAHTHLTEEIPSERDLITMMFSRVIDNCMAHVVINPKQIFIYASSSRLTERLQALLKDAESSNIDNDVSESIHNDLEEIANDLLRFVKDEYPDHIKVHVKNILDKIHKKKSYYSYKNLEEWIELIRLIITRLKNHSNKHEWIRQLSHIGIEMRVFDI